jgi:hypothetical protein
MVAHRRQQRRRRRFDQLRRGAGDSARAMMAAASSDCDCIYVLPNCRRRTVSFSQHPFAIDDDVRPAKTVCQVRVRRACKVCVKRR